MLTAWKYQPGDAHCCMAGLIVVSTGKTVSAYSEFETSLGYLISTTAIWKPLFLTAVQSDTSIDDWEK